MGIFGWSYPPGCEGTPADEPDGPCDVCGGQPDHDCICPECPECGTWGDPLCYIPGRCGLSRNPAQVAQRWLVEEANRAEAEAEAAWLAKYGGRT